MKKKLLITSILSVIMCMSLIVGATFALFTSEDNVDITVTSGEVKIEAEIANTQYKTLQEDWTSFDTTANLAIGGAITVDNTTGAITFDKVVPGDGIKFDVNVDNSSNVKVKFRTIATNTSLDNTLFNALKISVNGQEFYGKTATKWVELEAEVDPETIKVEIELPEDVKGDEYMKKTCTLNVLVEAVQGNADVLDDVIIREDVTTDATTNLTTEDKVLDNNEYATAKFPAGVKLKPNSNSLTFTVQEVDEVKAGNGNFSFGEGAEFTALDISVLEVDGENNNEVITITLEDILPSGLDNVILFHDDVQMTPVKFAQDKYNADEFFYDKATGYITLATTHFSNFTIVVCEEGYGFPKAGIEYLKEDLYPTVDEIWDLAKDFDDFPKIREDIALEKAFIFSATQTAEEAELSPYKNWLCDFVISCDQDVALGELGLSGQFGDANMGGNVTWYTFGNPITLTAGEQLPMLTSFGRPQTYYDICKYVKVFSCGIFRGQNNNSMAGKTITVSLCIADIETVASGLDREPTMEDFSEKDGTLITIASITYKFEYDGVYVSNFDELKVALESGKNACLKNDIVAVEGETIKVEEGVVAELDFNGKTLTACPKTIAIDVYGDLTIVNGSAILTAPLDSGSGAGVFGAQLGGTLTFENFTLDIDGGLTHGITLKNGTLNLNNGTIINVKGNGYQTGIISLGKDVVNINGADIVISAPADSTTSVGIGTYGTLTVNANSGSLIVSDGATHYGVAPFYGTIVVELSSDFVTNVNGNATLFEQDVVVNNK